MLHPSRFHVSSLFLAAIFKHLAQPLPSPSCPMSVRPMFRVLSLPCPPRETNRKVRLLQVGRTRVYARSKKSTSVASFARICSSVAVACTLGVQFLPVKRRTHLLFVLAIAWAATISEKLRRKNRSKSYQFGIRNPNSTCNYLPE